MRDIRVIQRSAAVIAALAILRIAHGQIQPCGADIVEDGTIDGKDLSYVISAWGETDSPANIDRSELSPTVDGQDLAKVLASWGRACNQVVIPDATLENPSYSEDYLQPTRLVFPNLTSVTGSLHIYRANNLVEVSMPLLESVHGFVYVDDNQQLETVSMPALRSIQRYLYISRNASLLSFDACGLADIFCDENGYGEPYISVSHNNPGASICTGSPTLHGTVLSTSPITSFSHNTAIAGGVFATRCSGYSSTGVCWSTSPNPTTSDSVAETFSGGMSFSVTMTGLAPATTYYVRAFSDSTYGNQVSFTTQP
jgi:hypothetical protein